jgi:hypothetical protein
VQPFVRTRNPTSPILSTRCGTCRDADGVRSPARLALWYEAVQALLRSLRRATSDQSRAAHVTSLYGFNNSYHHIDSVDQIEAIARSPLQAAARSDWMRLYRAANAAHAIASDPFEISVGAPSRLVVVRCPAGCAADGLPCA